MDREGHFHFQDVAELYCLAVLECYTKLHASVHLFMQAVETNEA